MMNRRDWTLIIGLAIATWGVDQLTKAWAVAQLHEMRMFGPVGLVLAYNPGIVFGTFAHLPPILRVVSLSTSGAFLIFIYAALQVLIPSRSLFLRAGMSLLLGGIIGNVTDRIVGGQVVDFVFFRARGWTSPVFNFADAIQWVGYLLLVYGLIKESSLFWPAINGRKSVWVNPRFQLRYCLTLTGFGLGFAVVNGVFAFTFLKATIDDLTLGNPVLAEGRFLGPFLLTYSIITVGFMFALFVLGRILSHRTAGPIRAFENYIRDLLSGKERSLRLRNGDELRDNLHDLAEKLQPIIKDSQVHGRHGRKNA